MEFMYLSTKVTNSSQSTALSSLFASSFVPSLHSFLLLILFSILVIETSSHRYRQTPTFATFTLYSSTQTSLFPARKKNMANITQGSPFFFFDMPRENRRGGQLLSYQTIYLLSRYSAICLTAIRAALELVIYRVDAGSHFD